MRLIFLMGVYGSGKTTLGNSIAKSLSNSEHLEFGAAPKALFNIANDHYSLSDTLKVTEEGRGRVNSFANYTCKQLLGDDIWARVVLKQVNESTADTIVISDLRFQIELDAFKDFEYEVYCCGSLDDSMRQYPLNVHATELKGGQDTWLDQVIDES